MNKEIILAAAIKQGITIYALPAPARHNHVIMQINKETGERPVTGVNFGFLTNRGRFVDREEARTIAVKNGQCPKPKHGLKLFSEDLW